MPHIIANTKQNASIIASLAINPRVIVGAEEVKIQYVARLVTDDKETIAHMFAGKGLSMAVLSLQADGRVHMDTVPFDACKATVFDIIKF